MLPPAGRLTPPHATLNAKVTSSECLLNRLDAGPDCTRLTHGARVDIVTFRSARAADNVRSYIGTISHRGLCDGGRLSAEAFGSANRRGVGGDSIGRGLPPASAARAYLGHCFAALTRFCTD